MNTATSSSEAIRGVFTQPARDMVSMVDDVLTVCGEHNLELDWSAECCRVHSQAEDFARSALICRCARPHSEESLPGSPRYPVQRTPSGLVLTPYGGQGAEIALSARRYCEYRWLSPIRPPISGCN